MTKQNWFIVINVILVIIAGVICFRNFWNFRKTLYWLLFPDSISIWSKKQWNKDFKNTFRFEVFAILVTILAGINYLILSMFCERT